MEDHDVLMQCTLNLIQEVLSHNAEVELIELTCRRCEEEGRRRINIHYKAIGSEQSYRQTYDFIQAFLGDYRRALPPACQGIIDDIRISAQVNTALHPKKASHRNGSL